MNSLKLKVSLILLGVFLLLVLIDSGISRFVIYPSFLRLEREEAFKDMDRVVQAINREIFHLDSLCHDWAAWDDTYDFMENHNQEYLKTNLPESSFSDNKLNLIALFDTQGSPVYFRMCNYNTGETLNSKIISDHPRKVSDPLISFNHHDKSLADTTEKGLILTEYGPMLISSRPVLTGNNLGPIRGSIIMGRIFDDHETEQLVKQIRVPFKVFALNSDSLTDKQKNIVSSLNDSDNRYQVTSNNHNQLEVYTKLDDISKKDAILIKATLPAKISARGFATIKYALLSTCTAIVIVLLIVVMILQRIILNPITHLTKFALSIGVSGNLTEHIHMKRKDEIGTLAAELNRMLKQLSEYNKKLLEQSYQSGMAEISSNILHHLHNSMNPIMANVEKLYESMEKLPIKEITNAHGELALESISSNRKKDLTDFIVLAGKKQTDLIIKGKRMLYEVAENATEMEHLFSEYQKWAFSERVSERFLLQDLVNEQTYMIQDDKHPNINITIDPSVNEVGMLNTHRTSLTRILDSILVNAVESIQSKQEPQGQIIIKAKVITQMPVDNIHLQICDNGRGIEKDKLLLIFERGFSTKISGATGIGLHWCANAMSILKGRIWAESEGHGQGACIHLIFPRTI